MTEAIWVAIIVQSSLLLGLIIKAVMDHKAKKAGNNPHPCGDHTDKLKELDNKLDLIVERVSKIEGILNGTYRKK